MIQNITNVRLQFYVCKNQVWNLPDEFILDLFDRAEKDGVKDMIFYGDPDYTKEMFLDKLKYEPHNIFFAVYGDAEYQDGTVKTEIGGFGYCDEIRWDHCNFHFCIFKEFWGKDIVKTACNEIRRQLHEAKFSLMWGVVPKDNEYALRFVENIGLIKGCVMPQYFYNKQAGKYIDGVMYLSERGDV